MARIDALNLLSSRNKSPLEFQWDSLFGPSVYQLIRPSDVEEMRKIATSVKLAGDSNKKRELVRDIMRRNGFMRFHGGTNRDVYTYYENPNFVAKVAMDRVGMSDNPREFQNQWELKPFVTKCFDVTPCGTIATFERVEPINSIEEFAYVYEDTFDLITKCIVGKYVLEDIGAKFFNNYGIRKGFGVCLLDYPYMYKLDGNKLICNRPIFPNTKEPVCGGEIDYDDGFNYLVCRCCGKRYSAKDLEDARKDGTIIITGGKHMLRVSVKKDGKTFKMAQSTNKIEKPVSKATGRISGKVGAVLVRTEEVTTEKPVDVGNTTTNDYNPNMNQEISDAIVDTLKSAMNGASEEKASGAQKPVRRTKRAESKKEEKPVSKVEEPTDITDDAYSEEEYLSKREKKNIKKTSSRAKKNYSKDDMTDY